MGEAGLKDLWARVESREAGCLASEGRLRDDRERRDEAGLVAWCWRRESQEGRHRPAANDDDDEE
jgi:hypothetical protein